MSTALPDPLASFDDDQPDIGPPKWWLHIVLFIATCCTMFLAGMYFAEADPFALASWTDPSTLVGAGSYMVCVMLIIFSHEMGHYLMAKRHGLGVSPPYFLPGIPIPPFGILPLMGTFGAFIQLQLKPLSAKKLLDVGAWGPLAGFVVTVPVMLLGIYLSDVRPLPVPVEGSEEGLMSLGNSVLMWAGTALFHPDVPQGHDVFMHPVAMAGWTGCFLTAYNLLPLGQLDGGHIAYTVFGERFNRIAPWLFGAFVIIGVVGFTGWLLLAALIWRMGARHPSIIRGELVRGRDRWLAWASLGMFVVTFAPEPIVMPSVLDHVLALF